jgi:O-antigen/teichoic acid export membrane protein
MWVNVTDSLLSIVLVILLIPRLGIMGYAVVIIVMEAYNFVLSLLRLRKRIRISIKPMRSAVGPLISALSGAIITKKLFVPAGANATVPILVATAVFTLCATFLTYKSIMLVAHCIQKLRLRIL